MDDEVDDDVDNEVDNELVVVRSYGDELSARIAAMTLEANGVPAQVSPDNAGGALPSLALVFPVRLIVRSEDAELALTLLDTPADQRTDGMEQGEQHDDDEEDLPG